ncbi:alpha-amylase family protein [Carboxylicivirga taeanensis]|uniref:alpha-amylase family protein n=1 Tax=Carboxylicivirga taeanensis TaxID=1416875 RepID=UPI003F6DCB3F
MKEKIESKKKIIIYQLLPRLFGNLQRQMKVNGSRRENGCGKFNAINERALQALHQMGISHLWLTGVIEHGQTEGYPDLGIENGNPLIIKGKAGSPYAIKDYYDVSADLAENVAKRMEEFESLIARVHESGLKVIIDFVPNHLARDYASDSKPPRVVDFGATDDSSVSFSCANNFYYLPNEKLQLPTELLEKFPGWEYDEYPAKVTGNDSFTSRPGINDWYETVKLNYGVDYKGGQPNGFTPPPDTWLKMKQVLLYWAAKGVDGFRCDMAEMVPVQFWEWVIPELKTAFPHLVFIAEVYDPSLYQSYVFQGHFDFLYDKVGLYDTLIGVLKGAQPASDISHCWLALQGMDPYMLRFMENHDEQRLASRFIAGQPEMAIPAMAVCAFLHQGPLMLYNGQEVGEQGEGPCGFSGDDGRTTIFDYWHLPEHQKWMNEGRFDGAGLSDEQRSLREAYIAINLLCQQPAISQGRFYDVMWHNKDNPYLSSDVVYAFLRYSSEQRLLIVCNFSNADSKIMVKVPAHALELMQILRPSKLELHSLKGHCEAAIGSERLIREGLSLQVPANDFLVVELSH